MSNKKDSYVSEDHSGWEWHLEFGYTPDLPCPFPIVPAGTRAEHDAVDSASEPATLRRRELDAECASRSRCDSAGAIVRQLELAGDRNTGDR
jgi:hypothetical protein